MSENDDLKDKIIIAEPGKETIQITCTYAGERSFQEMFISYLEKDIVERWDGGRVTVVIGKSAENHILSQKMEKCSGQTYVWGVRWSCGRDLKSTTDTC